LHQDKCIFAALFWHASKCTAGNLLSVTYCHMKNVCNGCTSYKLSWRCRVQRPKLVKIVRIRRLQLAVFFQTTKGPAITNMQSKNVDLRTNTICAFPYAHSHYCLQIKSDLLFPKFNVVDKTARFGRIPKR